MDPDVNSQYFEIISYNCAVRRRLNCADDTLIVYNVSVRQRNSLRATSRRGWTQIFCGAAYLVVI